MKAPRQVDDGTTTRDQRGEWVPRIMQKGQPFAWPIQPKTLLRYFFGFPGFMWPFGVVAYYGLATLTWRFLQPGATDLSNFLELQAWWILPMWARNVALLVLVAGTLHFVLYRRRAQGTRFKYNARWPSTSSKAFLFRSQVWDNVFWSIVSGATFWTAYEGLALWAYAHGWFPMITLSSNPVWFLLFFAVLPFWHDLHFYWAHRLFHWKPLYRLAHYLHHRNTNVGPWSGLSMHPIEHLLYFTRWIVLFVFPSHPIHMLYLMQRPALNPAIGHTGFDQLVVKAGSGTDTDTDTRLRIDSFFHYLHHRYFECNYGTNALPLDRWFGSWHDGSPESYARMRGKRELPPEADAVP